MPRWQSLNSRRPTSSFRSRGQFSTSWRYRRGWLGARRVWFGLQLVVGVLWSVAFFWMQNIALGLGVVLTLLIAIVITIVFFDRVSRVATLLLVPYVLWVSFAAALNYAIWLLNS